MPSPLIEKINNNFHIHYDILGLIYWQLARVEEIGNNRLDSHNRFPASSSHAFKNSYLDRPLVDEWLNILGQVLLRNWNGLRLKDENFKIRVTCDVDIPFYNCGTFKGTVRNAGRALLRKKSVSLAFKDVISQVETKLGNYKSDLYLDNINYIMDVNESNNNKVMFYMLVYETDSKRDNINRFRQHRLEDLLELITSRGHEVGIHPGYNTYLDEVSVRYSLEKFYEMIDKKNIQISSLCGRQHYLRWKTPDTAMIYDKCDIKNDSTLGYADNEGFRCGSCKEFQFFDARKQKMLNLRESPLVLMEQALLDHNYKGLSSAEEIIRDCMAIKEKCRKVNGTFNLLWHNNTLHIQQYRKIYELLINVN